MINISVIIPVYGVEKYIDQLLESVRRQKMENVEVIFVDDGSPDECPRILDEFVKEDARYKVIHQKNGGVSVARNTGLAHATGEYVYIIDSDDWLEDGALENLWAEATRTHADLIYGDWVSETASGSILRHSFNREFCTENRDTIEKLQCAVNNNSYTVDVDCPEVKKATMGGAPWRAMIKRAVIEKNKLAYDPYVKGLGDDILFMLHVYQYVKKVAYIQKPIYHYRTVAVSYSNGYKAQILENYSRIYERMVSYLNQYNKGEMHWRAFYFRVLIYFQQSMSRYFKNVQNQKSEKERYAEMKTLLESEPYHSALQKASIGSINGVRHKVGFMLLKLRLFRVYWILKR